MVENAPDSLHEKNSDSGYTEMGEYCQGTLFSG